ncbi:helix-turn-helix transcriptional regulator [Cuniculiplasma sp. SKW3]|uniref:helix-turn-helix transcriptional regulator n=1 Tax=unclassified Cuniculiplasma TaxID=2619706 RepID=UPI003FD1E41C
MENEGSYSAERKLYVILRKNGPSTLNQISIQLGMSKMGALKWINKLEAQGKIERRVKKLHMGRPAYVFSLTSDSNMPSENAGSERILVDLLEFMKRMKQNEIAEQFLRQRYELLYSQVYKQFQGKTFEDKLNILRELRERDGYMPEVKQNPSDNYNLVEYNCPIFRVSSIFPVACELERRLFESLLNADVENSHRQTNGKNTCVFNIKKIKND